MRKRVVTPQDGDAATAAEDPGEWLDLEALADVELTSEDPAHPIESALVTGRGGAGWRAAEAGPQTITLLFAEPQRIRRLVLEFVEPAVARTQEFVVRWSPDRGRTFHEVLRQQWNFSPGGSDREVEDQSADLDGVTVLEVRIVPDIGGGAVPASLARLQLA